MKLAKKMVLFFALTHRSSSIVYEDLYARLPLAESTIRGIVMEFVDEHLLERSLEGNIRITRTGLEEAERLFPRLFPTQIASRYTLIIFPKMAAGRASVLKGKVSAMGFSLLRTGVFLRPGALSRQERQGIRSYHELLVCENVSLGSEQLYSSLLATIEGKAYLHAREKLVSLLASLKKKTKGYQRSRYALASFWKKVYAEMILQAAEGGLFLEEYFQKEMRLNELLKHI